MLPNSHTVSYRDSQGTKEAILPISNHKRKEIERRENNGKLHQVREK
jgi:hypothetical protein